MFGSLEERGGYADVDGVTIDILRGTAKLTSANGFGSKFDQANGTSNVMVHQNGTLDLNDQESTISDITLEGGDGSGTVQDYGQYRHNQRRSINRNELPRTVVCSVVLAGLI